VFDLFCGEGIYEDGGKGSPIIILETINDIHQSSQANKKKTGHFICHFNDFEGSKVDKLEYIISERTLFKDEIGKLTCTREDYQVLLPKILAQIGDLQKDKAFVFIDPYGYKDISVRHILALLANRKTEVLLFLPTQFMFRFESKGTPESLKDFINELVPKDLWPRSETGVEFIENLRDGFRRALGRDFFVDSFIITRDRNQFFSAVFLHKSHLRV
jgi:three-Cys-motif partner protein